MAFLTGLFPADVARRSMEKASVELANALAAYALNMPLASAGITTATTTSKVKTVNTMPYQIAGAFYSLAGSDNFWTLGGTTSATTVAASSWQKYILLVDTAGTATVQEGVQSLIGAANVTFSNVSGLGRWAPLISLLNAGKVIAGVVTIATDSTHTFTPGTTAVATGSGITATFTNGLDQTLLPLLANQTGLLMGLGG